MHHLRRRALPALALVAIAACHRGPKFDLRKFTSNQALFDASLLELKRHRWDHAIAGFEKLTTDLPARDPLLPQAFYYLGEAHFGHNEYILAAQAFSRVPESFPEDTLAPLATYESGVSYSRLWKRPSLDPDYGETALSTFQSFLAAYPDSPLRPKAEQQIRHLNEWFAQKGYLNGVLYYKRKAYDSAIIYFRDVVKLYPETGAAKQSLLKLAQAYHAIHYRDEERETCATLFQKYAGDRDVHDVCGVAPVAQKPDTTPHPNP